MFAYFDPRGGKAGFDPAAVTHALWCDRVPSGAPGGEMYRNGCLTRSCRPPQQPRAIYPAVIRNTDQRAGAGRGPPAVGSVRGDPCARRQRRRVLHHNIFIVAYRRCGPRLDVGTRRHHTVQLLLCVRHNIPLRRPDHPKSSCLPMNSSSPARPVSAALHGVRDADRDGTLPVTRRVMSWTKRWPRPGP